MVGVKRIAGNNAIQANKALNLSGNGNPIWKDYHQTFMAFEKFDVVSGGAVNASRPAPLPKIGGIYVFHKGLASWLPMDALIFLVNLP